MFLTSKIVVPNRYEWSNVSATLYYFDYKDDITGDLELEVGVYPRSQAGLFLKRMNQQVPVKIHMKDGVVFEVKDLNYE